jgi:hypothetical protein
MIVSLFEKSPSLYAYVIWLLTNIEQYFHKLSVWLTRFQKNCADFVALRNISYKFGVSIGRSSVVSINSSRNCVQPPVSDAYVLACVLEWYKKIAVNVIIYQP